MYLQRYEKVPIIGNFFSFLSRTTHSNAIKTMLRKLLTPNIQRVKSIRAIRISTRYAATLFAWKHLCPINGN